ncbi:MAG TPA: hypothetical protein VK826_13145 [Bacteroidia bacterium]|nr:hypothetical protein [Bacteroidia bacterium]
MIPEQPKTLEFFRINSYTDISDQNVTEARNHYGLEDAQSAPAVRIVSCILRVGQSQIITIPEGYQANAATIIISAFAAPPVLVLNGIIGTATFSNTEVSQTLALNGQTGMLPVAVTADMVSQDADTPPQIADVVLMIEISCGMTVSYKTSWQQEIYGWLHDGYEKKMVAYRTAIR